MRLVGILGGMGPEATVLLMQKVIALRTGGGDADHVPLLVHQNPQVPSRIAALIDGTGESPAPVLAEMARVLEAGGAKALAMPCNTAHAYAEAITAAVTIPFLDMIALSTSALGKKGARIGMLASPAVHRARVFDAAFDTVGLTMVLPQDEAPVLDLIRTVKAGRVGEDRGAVLAGLAEGLILQGADHVAIACTELSLLTPYLPDDLPWTDTLDCLSEAIVQFSLTGRLPATSD